MIIFPTEKSFDWQHAPFVVLAIVLLNVLVFVFYQSKDMSKFQQAYFDYAEHGLLELEWPFYENYQQDEQQLSQMQQYVDDELYDQVVYEVLQDEAFFDYLKLNHQQTLQNASYGEWLEYRQRAQDSLNSMSSLAYGLNPADNNWYSFVTHQFLHGGFMHIFGNMLFLLIFGFAVEAAIGHLRFLLFYLVSGVGAGAFFSLMNQGSDVPLVGASGAISGVMAMYLGVFRFKKIEFFYWILIFVGYFRAPALLILPFYIGKEFWQYFTVEDSNVAFMAHVGGFVSGAILLALVWAFLPKTMNKEYIEDSVEDDEYQRKLAQVYQAMEKFRFANALQQLDELEAEFGADHDTAWLRLTLMQALDHPNLADHIVALLVNGAPTMALLQKLKTLWQRYPDISAKLSDEQKIDMAIRFATSTDCQLAEKIFVQLSEQNCKLANMAVLARRISLSYEQQQNQAKMQHYGRQADALLEGI